MCYIRERNIMQLIKAKENDYKIEGLTDIQVLRIYKALESVNNKSQILELDVMVNCLKIDMDNLNKEL